MAANRILVPVDGSKCSTRALDYAVKRRMPGQSDSITVLNVQPGIPSSRYVSRSMIAEHQERQAKAALKPVRDLLKRYKSNANILLRVGDPAATIVEFAKKNRCTEIVLGNSGRGKISTILLGSVAAKVIQLASCPVTVVK